MPELYVNKLNINSETRFDISADTVTPETLMTGTTAHSASGAPITGILDPEISAVTQGNDITITNASDAEIISLSLYGKSVNGENIGDGGSVTVMSSSASSAKTATITTGLPLRGKAVTEDGNYTDENGQQWIADEIDAIKGVIITRIDDDSTTVLSEPITTPLTEAEATALRGLRTFAGSTEITATDSPFMSVRYIKNTENGSSVSAIADKLGRRISKNISVSPLLTLNAENWDDTEKTQTVTFAHNTAKRNVIDITPNDIESWAASGIYAISETAEYITFKCAEIPSSDLTFKITSMEVG